MAIEVKGQAENWIELYGDDGPRITRHICPQDGRDALTLSEFRLGSQLGTNERDGHHSDYTKSTQSTKD